MSFWNSDGHTIVTYQGEMGYPLLALQCQHMEIHRTCPKDDFPTPMTEMVVDATTGYGALSFMDGFSGYNQIKMDENDAYDTAF